MGMDGRREVSRGSRAYGWCVEDGSGDGAEGVK